MANYDSGSVTSSPGITGGGIRCTFDWWINENDINKDSGTATVHYNFYISGGTDNINAMLVMGNTSNNYLYKNSMLKLWDFQSGYTDGAERYYSAREDGKKQLYDQWGNPTGYWMYFYHNLRSNQTFTVNYNDEGNGSFTITAKICAFEGQTSSIDRTFTLRQIDRYKKGRRTTNYGSTWTKDVYFHKTTDGGRTWTKCNAYKTENSGSNWTKIS